MFSVILIFVVVGAIFVYITRTFDYWKTRGVKHDQPFPLLGTNAKAFLIQKSTTQLAADMYWKYPNERVVGFFRSSSPELIIRDPQIVKLILLTEFEKFHLRGVVDFHNDSTEPLERNLFNADGDTWRLLRQHLTPAFTISKLKTMIPLIVERVERLHARIHASCGAPIDAQDLMALFTVDIMSACVFGLDTDALTDDDSEIRKLSLKITNITQFNVAKFLIREVFPSIGKRIPLTDKIEKDVMNLVKSILVQRNYEPSGRNDFVDSLLEGKKKGIIIGESLKKENPIGKALPVTLELSDDLITAQAFLFFSAGFIPPSFSLSLTLHLLAYHPLIQEKVQKSIDDVLHKHKKLSYEAIKELTYLEWTVKESLRIYPPVGFLIRSCARKYTFSDLGFTIDAGVKIMIPTQAMQNDPQYFENPSEFRPERFDPKVLDVDKIKYVYLPFGDGLRSCIGAKFTMMLLMGSLAAVLSKYTVEPSPSSVRYPHIETKPGIIQIIKGDVPLIFRERKKEQ